MAQITNEVLAERIDNFREYVGGELKEIKDHLIQLNGQVAKNTAYRNKSVGVISALALFWGLVVTVVFKFII
jgi:hypothetical protein